MSKRAPQSFPRVKDDFYATHPKLIEPLLPHLAPGTRFYEPCAGLGNLADVLVEAGHVCTGMSDINPMLPSIVRCNALQLTSYEGDCIITNPPWEAGLMHRMIWYFLSLDKPFWLLVAADWAMTNQASTVILYCTDIVAAGRMKIIGKPGAGYDNLVWVRFDPDSFGNPRFHPRV